MPSRSGGAAFERGRVGRNNDRSREAELVRARDELCSHIHRRGVLRASAEHQLEWMNDTVEYLGERYPALDAGDLEQLKQIGVRFCRPVIRRAEGPGSEPVKDGTGAVARKAALA